MILNALTFKFTFYNNKSNKNYKLVPTDIPTRLIQKGFINSHIGFR